MWMYRNIGYGSPHPSVTKKVMIGNAPAAFEPQNKVITYVGQGNLPSSMSVTQIDSGQRVSSDTKMHTRSP